VSVPLDDIDCSRCPRVETVEEFFLQRISRVSVMMLGLLLGFAPHQLYNSNELPIFSELLELLDRRIHNP